MAWSESFSLPKWCCDLDLIAASLHRTLECFQGSVLGVAWYEIPNVGQTFRHELMVLFWLEFTYIRKSRRYCTQFTSQEVSVHGANISVPNFKHYCTL